jgi:hypothetical protein
MMCNADRKTVPYDVKKTNDAFEFLCSTTTRVPDGNETYIRVLKLNVIFTSAVISFQLAYLRFVTPANMVRCPTFVAFYI